MQSVSCARDQLFARRCCAQRRRQSQLTDGQQPAPQHDSPALQNVFAQQLELEEMQKGAIDRSGGMQQVSVLHGLSINLCSCARMEDAMREKGKLTVRIETLAAHASATDIEAPTR